MVVKLFVVSKQCLIFDDVFYLKHYKVLSELEYNITVVLKLIFNLKLYWLNNIWIIPIICDVLDQIHANIKTYG